MWKAGNDFSCLRDRACVYTDKVRTISVCNSNFSILYCDGVAATVTVIQDKFSVFAQI